MTLRSATVHAQAKINLFLRVLAREESGYHQLETTFCRIALGDTVRVRTTGGPCSLTVSGDSVPREGLGPAAENLAWRAAEAYRSATGWPAGFEIAIGKRIPVGAGLGGGSADAGAVLRILNALSENPVPAETLLGLAASLGADVPFLTQEVSALALGWGRGERLLTLPPLPARPCLILVPDFRIVTADAYRWLVPRRGRWEPKAWAPGDFATWDSLAPHAFNEFEDVVFDRFPEYAAVLSGWRALPGVFDYVLMSGSGSSAFALPRLRGDEVMRIESDGAPYQFMSTATAHEVSPVQVDVD
jgi:4-diphosphocytidyl-2-C-methyl-D-erythritol kinase